jgi:hypothetical protein
VHSDSLRLGSLRRLPARVHAAVRATLRPLADRPGLPLPVPLVSRACQPYLRLDRPWAPTLQRLLPIRRRRILSDRAVPPAVSHLAVPRLRGFELFRGPLALRLDGSLERVRSLTMALFTPPPGRSSPGRFPPSRMTFRPRPTLLQGSSHGLFSSTRAWDSPQGCPRASSYAQIYVRSSEFQRTGSPPGFYPCSLRGPLWCTVPRASAIK